MTGYEKFLAARSALLNRMEAATPHDPDDEKTIAYRKQFVALVAARATEIAADLGLASDAPADLIEELSARELLCRMCGAKYDDCYASGVHNIACDRLFDYSLLDCMKCDEEAPCTACAET